MAGLPYSLPPSFLIVACLGTGVYDLGLDDLRPSLVWKLYREVLYAKVWVTF